MSAVLTPSVLTVRPVENQVDRPWMSTQAQWTECGSSTEIHGCDPRSVDNSQMAVGDSACPTLGGSGFSTIHSTYYPHCLSITPYEEKDRL